jgi:galactitol-specific phosphotransferase system IIB component
LKFWEDPYHTGNLAFYPYLGYLFYGLVSIIFNISPEVIMIFLPIVNTILASIAAFMIGKLIYKKYALFFPALFWVFRFYGSAKPSHGFGQAFFLFSVYYFLKILTTKSQTKKIDWLNKDGLLLGLFMGLTNLSHMQTSITLYIFLAGAVIGEWIYRRFNWNYFKLLFKKYISPLILSTLITSIFYLPLIIKYKLHSINLTQQYSLFDPTRFKLGWVLENAYLNIIRFDSIYYILIGIICIIGIIGTIIIFKKNIKYRIPIYVYIMTLVATAHYLITIPLFDVYAVPNHVAKSFFISIIMFQFIGICFLAKLFKKHKKIVLVVLVIVLMLVLNSKISSYKESQWTEFGKQMDGSTQAVFAFEDWIDKNTEKTDVFLAHDESAFMIAGLTARPVVMVRRTHASPYVDVDQRYADGVIMFYSHDLDKVKSLIKQYDVKYVYIDYMLVSNPIVINQRLESYIQENNIDYEIRHVRFDPSTEKAPSYDAIYIAPRNITILEHNILEQVYVVGQNNQAIGALYKVKI